MPRRVVKNYMEAPTGWKKPVVVDSKELYGYGKSVKYKEWVKLWESYPHLVEADRDDAKAYCEYLERKSLLEEQLDSYIYGGFLLTEEAAKSTKLIDTIRTTIGKTVDEIKRYELRLGIKRNTRRLPEKAHDMSGKLTVVPAAEKVIRRGGNKPPPVALKG